MPWIMTCSAGHSWMPAAAEVEGQPRVRCPVCGEMVGVPAPAAPAASKAPTTSPPPATSKAPTAPPPPPPEDESAAAAPQPQSPEPAAPLADASLLAAVQPRRPASQAPVPRTPTTPHGQRRHFWRTAAIVVVAATALGGIVIPLGYHFAVGSKAVPEPEATGEAIAPVTPAPVTSAAPPAVVPAPSPGAPKDTAAQLALQQKEEELRRKEAELQRRETELKNGQTVAAAPPEAPPSSPSTPDTTANVPAGPVAGPSAVQRGAGEARRSLTNQDDERVVDAMRRGAEALLGCLKGAGAPAPGGPRQGGNEIAQIYEEGKLAMGVYALLVVDYAIDDSRFHFSSPDMAPLVQGVVGLQTDKTYALALQASALALLPPKPEYAKALKRVRDQLLLNAHHDGAFSYGPPAEQSGSMGNQGGWDTSNSQYGLLGLWACDDAGIETPHGFWGIADTWWRGGQDTDGGWAYNQGQRGSSTATMTAAGLASLFVTIDKIDAPPRLTPLPDARVDAGLRWLSTDFERSRGDLGRNLYLAYGIERVGLACGYKYFGGHDWYRDGVTSMLAAQSPGGEWNYRGVGRDPQGIVGTSFALLFLARGRLPVVFNKLQYNGPWNARPRDAAHFTRWLVKKSERHINWQCVDIATAADDWLDAPILLLTGHGDPSFNSEQIAKLRHFAEAGGLIFSTADGADPTFTQVIRRKYAPAIADKQYEMRVLPQDHYLFTLDYKAKDRAPLMYGLSNGVRELWVHAPQDMGEAWQRYATARKEAWEIPANMYFYVSGRSGLRSKLQPLFVPDDGSDPGSTMRLVRVKYAGNWNPEPAAWPRFARIAKLSHRTRLTLDEVDLDQLDPARHPVAHITGTSRFSLSEAQQGVLAKYLQGGGLLIADTAGGSIAFAESFQEAIAKILPGTTLDIVEAAEHPILTGQFAGGERVETLGLRHFCRIAANRGRKLALLELKVKGRPAVLFFTGDISSGLLGTNTWGILGYEPATCESLAWNTLAYAKAVTGADGMPR